MKAIEVNTHTNQFGNLEINYPLDVKNRNVRVIILVDEEDEENLWMKSIAANPTFNFLNEEPEIYTLNDGKVIN